MTTPFYKYNADSLDSENISMSVYQGKTILVVNTAGKCGFTPQYEGLEQLYQKYKDKNFVILGFPCNQFGNQEPGDAKSISDVCHISYGVSFPMFAKIEVNGDNAHSIFKFLTEALPGSMGKNVKWNFTKFLINENGDPVKRFAPITSPEKIDKYLEDYLA